MQVEVIQYLQQHPNLANFVRLNPIWYRYLTREPQRIYELKKEAKKYYGLTFPQQAEKVSGHLQMLQMLMEMSKAMKD